MRGKEDSGMQEQKLKASAGWRRKHGAEQEWKSPESYEGAWGRDLVGKVLATEA